MMNDDELFLWYGWPMKDDQPYFQPVPLSEILTISNLCDTSRIWTYAEPEFRLCWMKLCSSVNYYITAPPTGAETINLIKSGNSVRPLQCCNKILLTSNRMLWKERFVWKFHEIVFSKYLKVSVIFIDCFVWYSFTILYCRFIVPWLVWCFELVSNSL